MLSSIQKKELILEFAELSDPGIVLQKEVYAHFGLLFFKFALIEHSLINVLTLNHACKELTARRICNKMEWEQAIEKGYDRAKKELLSTLVKQVSIIPEFARFADELAQIKNYRNYFAHHFFREGVGVYDNEEGCWGILWAIKELREKLVKLDRDIDVALQNMYKRLKMPFPSEETMKQEIEQVKSEASVRVSKGHIFPWHKFDE